MKVLNKICRFAAMIFGLASLVLFFTKFATISMGEVSKGFVGAQLAFGSEVTIEGAKYDMARSADILLCFFLTAISFLLSIFSFKSKNLRYAACGFGIVDAIYMLVIYVSGPWEFVDPRPLSYANITAMSYGISVLLTVIALALFVVAAVAYLLIDDYLEVLASKGEKLTILKRVIRFVRDYKSEIKKIVWPGIKDVIKSTVIVLIMCLLIGILIWAVDFGLGQLLNLILGA